MKFSGKWILLEWCESLSTMRTRTAEIQGATEYTKYSGPPELPEEELQRLDDETEAEELRRLVEMKVLRETDVMPEKNIILNAKMVYDWRFRGERWGCRARLVGRELKIWSPWRQDVFNPATTPSVVKIVPQLFVVNKDKWKLWSLDIKDAFLTVEQREEKYIWYRNKFYRLLMRLPGQRQAAQWWGDQIRSDLLVFGLQASKACPVLFGSADMSLTIHMDDLIIAGGRVSDLISVLIQA